MPDVYVSPIPTPAPVKVVKADHATDRRVLSSFRHHPANVRFETMDEAEEVVLLLRKHFFTNVRWILLTVVALFVPAIISLFPTISFVPSGYQFILVAGWYVLIVAFAFEQFISWFFNVYIVTTERVISVNFSNLVYRETSEADLDEIQDVTVQVGSVLRTLFNYGNVYIQTAAEVERLTFLAIPYPDKAVKIIRDLKEAEENKK